MVMKASNPKDPARHVGMLKRLTAAWRDAAVKCKLVWVMIVVVASVAVLVFCRFDILDTRFFVARNPSPLLAPRRPLIQEFQVRGRLSKLDINFGTHNSRLRGRLLLRLMRKQTKVFSTEIAGKKIRNNRFTRIPVAAPVPPGTYRMFLTYLPVEPGEKLSVWLSRKNQYLRGRLWVNGKLQPGDMLFRAYYRAGIWEGIRVLAQRFQAFAPWVLWLLLSLFVFFTVWTMRNWVFTRRP